MRYMLTKSKYLKGLQCAKLLWVTANEKARLPAADAAQQELFTRGHEVEEYAKSLFPGGRDLSGEGFRENLESTRRGLREGAPLFEAGMLTDNLYARADILDPAGDDCWDIIEVKSATSVKDVHIEDMAFQKHVYERAGVRVNRCLLMHIDTTYVREGELEPEKLLSSTDITAEVESASEGIEERIKEMFRVMREAEPRVPVGPHCTDPYGCDLVDECWDFLPEHGVDELYRGGKKTFELIGEGIYGIAQVPDERLSEKQKVQKACVTQGGAHVNKERVREWLKKLAYPLYYFDLETFSTPIPLVDGVRPYQQVPFQFSLHVQREPGGELEHHSYLASGREDPRPGLLSALHEQLGDGSVVVYNKSFETRQLRAMTESYPEYMEWVEWVIPRIADLHEPFKEFWYHDARQHGSNSLKYVLAAVTGEGYEDMEIADGQAASREFLRITDPGNPVTETEARRVREHLEAYCGLDTEGMVWILERLRGV